MDPLRINKDATEIAPVRSSTIEPNARTPQEIGQGHSHSSFVAPHSLEDKLKLLREELADGHSYDAIILEAQKHYGGNKPDFCVCRQEVTTKNVKLLGTEELCEMKLEDWSGKVGFWVLTDKNNDRHIVKNTSGRWYVWRGVDKGFTKAHIAETPRPKQKAMIVKQKASRRAASEMDTIESKSLRPRKAIQSKPYTVYNAQMKHQAEGVQLSETQLEEVVATAAQPPAPSATQSSPPAKRRKLRHSSSTNPVDNVQPIPDQADTLLPPNVPTALTLSRDSLLQNTLLRTRFHGFEDATIPLTATNYTDHASLFRCIRKKWEFKLKGREILYCIAMFPWLGSDKNILLQETELDGLDTILDEVREAPGQGNTHRIEVVVTVHVKDEVENLMA